uniref:Uncharacterized protein n=1 Tax=Grammatophora oceanica TaxID=210454 RepID=A0A7S1UL34_9STRA
MKAAEESLEKAEAAPPKQTVNWWSSAASNVGKSNEKPTKAAKAAPPKVRLPPRPRTPVQKAMKQLEADTPKKSNNWWSPPVQGKASKSATKPVESAPSQQKKTPWLSLSSQGRPAIKKNKTTTTTANKKKLASNKNKPTPRMAKKATKKTEAAPPKKKEWWSLDIK